MSVLLGIESTFVGVTHQVLDESFAEQFVNQNSKKKRRAGDCKNHLKKSRSSNLMLITKDIGDGYG